MSDRDPFQLRVAYPLVLPPLNAAGRATAMPAYVQTPYPLLRASYLTRETAKSHMLLWLLGFATRYLQTAHVLLSESHAVFPFEQRVYKAVGKETYYIVPLESDVAPFQAFLAELQGVAESYYDEMLDHFASPDAVERAMYHLVVSYVSDAPQETHLTLDFLKRKYEYLNDLVKTITRTLYHNMGLA